MRKIIFIIGLLAAVAGGCGAAQAAQLHYPKDNEQNITLKGEAINDTVFAFGNNVTVNAPIHGDLFAAGQRVEINAPVDGNLFVGAQTTVIGGTIKQDAFVGTSSLTFTNKATVTKNLYYAGNKNDALAGSVKGNIVTPPEKTIAIATPAERARDTFLGALTLLLTGMVLLRLFPQTISTIAANIVPHWGKNFLFGILTIIVVPIVAMLLMASGIGTPLGLIIMALWLWELYVAVVIGAAAIGQLVLKKQQNSLIQYTAGVVIITLLRLLPGLMVILIAIIIFTLGSIVLTKYELYQKLRGQL